MLVIFLQGQIVLSQLRKSPELAIAALLVQHPDPLALNKKFRRPPKAASGKKIHHRDLPAPRHPGLHYAPGLHGPRLQCYQVEGSAFRVEILRYHQARHEGNGR